MHLLTWLQEILCFGYRSTWSSLSIESSRMKCAPYSFECAILHLNLDGGTHAISLGKDCVCL